LKGRKRKNRKRRKRRKRWKRRTRGEKKIYQVLVKIDMHNWQGFVRFLGGDKRVRNYKKMNFSFYTQISELTNYKAL